MTDKEIQQAVLRELEWEPQVGSTEIGVSVKDCIVTLTGYVDSYSLEVKLPSSSVRTDEDLARAAVRALEDRVNVPRDRIKVIMREGWITLEGEVEWSYQRAEAEKAVRRLRGVKGVINLIAVTSRLSPSPAEIKARIEDALRRSAALDAERIAVEVQGSKVILRGQVRSWVERAEAQLVAWRAPGVTQVENHITVEPASGGSS